MKINFEGEEQLKKGLRELQKETLFVISDDGFSVRAVRSDEVGYRIVKNSQGAEIRYRKYSDFYYAFIKLIVNFSTVKNQSGQRCVNDFGFMADCSRNGVLNVDTVKRLIRELAELGYDYLMLYTEDTLEIKDSNGYV